MFLGRVLRLHYLDSNPETSVLFTIMGKVSRVDLGSRDLVFNSCYQQTFSRELCPYQNYSVSVHSDNNGGQGILVAAMLLKKASISLGTRTKIGLVFPEG